MNATAHVAMFTYGSESVKTLLDAMDYGAPVDEVIATLIETKLEEIQKHFARQNVDLNGLYIQQYRLKGKHIALFCRPRGWVRKDYEMAWSFCLVTGAEHDMLKQLPDPQQSPALMKLIGVTEAEMIAWCMTIQP